MAHLIDTKDVIPFYRELGFEMLPSECSGPGMTKMLRRKSGWMLELAETKGIKLRDQSRISK